MHAIHIQNIAGVYMATAKSAHPNQGGYIASGLSYRDSLIKLIRTMHAHGEHLGIGGIVPAHGGRTSVTL